MFRKLSATVKSSFRQVCRFELFRSTVRHQSYTKVLYTNETYLHTLPLNQWRRSYVTRDYQ